jgi:hypothetical protein
MILAFLVIMILIKLILGKFIDEKNLNLVLVVLGILSIIFPFVNESMNEQLIPILRGNIFDISFIGIGLFFMACYQLYLFINDSDLRTESLLSVNVLLALSLISLNIVWIKIIACLYYLNKIYVINKEKKVVFNIETPLILIIIMIIINENTSYNSLVLVLLMSILFIHTVFERMSINKVFVVLLLSSCSVRFAGDYSFVVIGISILAGMISFYYIMESSHQKLIVASIKNNDMLTKININLKSLLDRKFTLERNNTLFIKEVIDTKLRATKFIQSDHLTSYIVVVFLSLMAIFMGVKV